MSSGERPRRGLVPSRLRRQHEEARETSCAQRPTPSGKDGRSADSALDQAVPNGPREAIPAASEALAEGYLEAARSSPSAGTKPWDADQVNASEVRGRLSMLIEAAGGAAPRTEDSKAAARSNAGLPPLGAPATHDKELS